MGGRAAAIFGPVYCASGASWQARDVSAQSIRSPPESTAMPPQSGFARPSIVTSPGTARRRQDGRVRPPFPGPVFSSTFANGTPFSLPALSALRRRFLGRGGPLSTSAVPNSLLDHDGGAGHRSVPPGTFIPQPFATAHLYPHHIDQARLQLCADARGDRRKARSPGRVTAYIRIFASLRGLCTLEGYDPYPAYPARVACDGVGRRGAGHSACFSSLRSPGTA